MSDEMDIAVEMQEESRKDSTEEMELESESSTRSEENSMSEKSNSGYDITDSLPSDAKNFQQNVSPKINITEGNCTQTFNSRVAEPETSGLENSATSRRESADCKHLPPVFVNSQPFQQNLSDTSDSPFQKPTVCRTHSLGAGDPSPFMIRRRPARLAFQSQLRSPSAFKRKLRMQSPIRGDILDEMEDSVLKRCNSAPMLNDINDTDPRTFWQHGSITPGSIRARRFSATVIPVHSPSAGSSKSTSRLAQLKKEESLQGIQHKETAHEREVQTSIQMNHTCEELSLSDGLSGASSGGGDGPGLMPQVIVAPPNAERPPRSPLPSVPVSIPVPNKQCPSRSIDFNVSSLQYHNQQGIPSPLTISTSPLCLSPLPPSPTRNLGFSSTGKQCFSPSMQVPVPACLRPGSLSPSPSPTRRSFVTRRRSQSPCVLKPSVLGPMKRKYDSDSEGGSSPKRIFIPGSQPAAGNLQVEAFPQFSIVTPYFPRNYIHRSHSLSSGSIDSDITVSPSPSQAGVNIGFLPATHTLVLNPQSRDRNNGSPFQSPLHSTNSFSNTGGTHELGGCSSPASSTCSSSSLEGLKDLPPFPQSHLATHSSSNSATATLLKPLIKDRQSTVTSTKSTANVT